MSDELLPVLRNLHLLEEFPDELLTQLATVSRVEEFSTGAVIFRQGDAAQTIYVVRDGTVSLEICASGVGCRRILTVGPGELLGWSPILKQKQLTATARALSTTSVVACDGPQLLAMCEQNSRWGYEFMKRAALALAQRLSATRLQLLNVYGEQIGAPQPLPTE
jgi:CRP-like cAMP-binding protein